MCQCKRSCKSLNQRSARDKNEPWCRNCRGLLEGLSAPATLSRPTRRVFQLEITCSSYESVRGLIPSVFMRVISVVRLSPIRSAAPFAPPTRPLVSLRTRRILSRSSNFSIDAGVAFKESSGSSGIAISSLSVRLSTTARSTRFSSSRTLPGQCQRGSLRMDAVETLSIFFCIRRAYFCVKYFTSNGMSSGRSRKGGIRIGTTFRR
jgi:hypothetical protein